MVSSFDIPAIEAAACRSHSPRATSAARAESREPIVTADAGQGEAHGKPAPFAARPPYYADAQLLVHRRYSLPCGACRFSRKARMPAFASDDMRRRASAAPVMSKTFAASARGDVAHQRLGRADRGRIRRAQLRYVQVDRLVEPSGGSDAVNEAELERARGGKLRTGDKQLPRRGLADLPDHER